MKTRLLALALVFAAVAAQAQTVGKTLAWTQQNEALATVSTYTWALKIDAAPATAATATCQTAGANVTCTTPITLTAGNHTVVLTAINAAGLSASGTLNYVPGVAPATPSNIQITIQITVP